MKKIGLIFWWISNESEVSISSAKNIVDNFDKTKYDSVQIYRSKDNNFYIIDDIHQMSHSLMERGVAEILSTKDFKDNFDIAFLITHGKYGEDGVIQSILELEKIPYCWCRVLSSALCMNKAILKTFLKNHNINQVEFEVIDFINNTLEEIDNIKTQLDKKFQLPLYIKPANSWSSIWITKLTDRSKLDTAIQEAQLHDSTILIEQWLEKPQELEMWVIWNNKLNISQAWELIKDYDFYSFDQKYIINKMNIEIPAQIWQELLQEIKKTTEIVYKLCDCKWFARVDFFLHKNKLYFNEINTLPWFTEISAFPILMKATGMSYTQIINEIISLAY